MNLKDSPFAVICPEHGQVLMSETEYLAQLSNPDVSWACPICHEAAEFDEDRYERLRPDDLPDDDIPF